MVLVSEEQTKAKRMMMATIEQANAALAQLNATQDATKTMITKKREKITAANPLYRKISTLLPGPGGQATKENPMTLDEGEEENKSNNSEHQSETSSKFEQPKSRGHKLQAQIQSRSVVEKSQHDDQRNQKRKRHQKAPVSEPSVADDEEKSLAGSHLSSERVNAHTHAEQWVQMVKLMDTVQKTLKPWTIIHGQTLLSQISTALKQFPGGYLFPSAQTLEQWAKNYRQSIPMENCKSEAQHINDLIASFTHSHQPEEQAQECDDDENYDYPSVSQAGSLGEEEQQDEDLQPKNRLSIDKYGDDDQRTRSVSVGSPALQSTREPSSTKTLLPAMIGTGKATPIRVVESKRGNNNVAPKVGAPVERRETRNDMIKLEEGTSTSKNKIN
jgi:hypothetical protein